jgi:hypothetical protein
VPAAERSHEPTVEDEQDVADIPKGGEVEQFAAEIGHLKVGGWNIE